MNAPASSSPRMLAGRSNDGLSENAAEAAAPRDSPVMRRPREIAPRASRSDGPDSHIEVVEPEDALVTRPALEVEVRRLPPSLTQFALRIALATPFWRSGINKWDGFLTKSALLH